ncbi:hypothetical protein K458DRAFT_430231 [Lentithecium fluviatile CBS 122367]|uniref:Rhodopsin domain-containing protein n=1 Tax=Lentithecium fluviatile CBS 122367 TaxID=1168545 RepID=A0A6G1J8E6_9PLEO|nr:hypothetical protein K458DRAFT_430231 [Lentithecium fluviatile CBS 122367]
MEQDGVRPPPYIISADDKRGLVVVVTATALSFVIVCFLMRAWLRLRAGEWRDDDYILAAATIFHTAQAGLALHIVDEGFGKALQITSSRALDRIGKEDFTSQILYIVTLFFSKCAVLFLYLRLSPHKGHVVAAWASIVACLVWAIVAVVLIALPCNPHTFWRDGSDQCKNIWPRWQAIGTIDIVTEVTIFCIAIYIVAKLNMRRKTKVIVIMAFSARLPVIIAAAFRLDYLHAMLQSDDRNLDAVYVVVATQWHMAYAVMSTVITGLGPFLRPYSKTSTVSYPNSSNKRSNGYGSHPHTEAHTTVSGSMSYPMQTLPGRESKVSLVETPQSTHQLSHQSSLSHCQPHDTPPSDTPQTPTLILRPDAFARNTNVVGGNRPSSDNSPEDAMSRSSRESQQWIITKKTELTVETSTSFGKK